MKTLVEKIDEIEAIVASVDVGDRKLSPELASEAFVILMLAKSSMEIALLLPAEEQAPLLSPLADKLEILLEKLRHKPKGKAGTITNTVH